MKLNFAIILCLLSVAACEGPEPAPGVNTKVAKLLRTSESGEKASFTMVLNSEPKSNVSFNIASSDTTEGDVEPKQVIFTPSNWKTPITVNVNGINDDLPDGDITYIVSIDGAVSSDAKYSGLGKSNIPALNIDDDGPGNPSNKPASIIVTPQQVQTSEDLQSATVSVSLSQAPAVNSEVHIDVVSDNLNEGIVDISSGLTFTSGDWAEKTFTVTGQDDALVDGNINYQINLSVSESTESGHLPLDPAFANVVIAPVAAINIDNESTPSAEIVIEPTGTLQTSENGGQAVVNIHLTAQPSAAVILLVNSSNTAEGTVTPSQISFDANDFALNKTLTITGQADNIPDGDQSYVVEIDPSTSADANYAGLGIRSISVINIEPAAVNVALVDANSDENGDIGQISLQLNTAPLQNVTVNFNSSLPGEGQARVSNVTFDTTNWNTPQLVDIVGQDDDIVDGVVNYEISFSVSSGDSRYEGLSVTPVTLSNADNEQASLIVTPDGGVTTSESGSSAEIRVALGAKPIANDIVTVSAAVGNPNEGQIAPASLSFDQSNWNIAQAFTVTGINDNVVDGNVSYNVSFSVSAGSANPYNNLATTPYPVTNTDFVVAALPGVTVNAATPLLTSESGGSATFSVILDSQPGAVVTVNAVSSNLNEGVVTPSSVQFTSDSGGPTSWNTARTFTVTGQDDTIVDGNIDFQVTFSISSADTAYDGMQVAALNATNQDNDSVLPAVQVSVVSPTTVTNENGNVVEYDVVLSAAPSGTVTISASSDLPSEGTVTSGNMQFDAANFASPQRLIITGQDDAIVDGDVTYHINFVVSGNADSNVAQLTLVNQDNETADIVVDPELNVQTSESGASATVNVSLAAPPATGITVTVTANSQNPNEGIVRTPNTVSFTNATWNTPQTITIDGQDDAVIDGNVLYDVTWAISTTPAPNNNPYNNATHAPLKVTNLDNDMVAPTVTVSAATPLITDENLSTASFTVVLDSAPGSDVTIAAASSNALEGTVSPAAVTFTSGANSNWQIPQTFIVTGQDDTRADGDVTYSIAFTVSGAQTPASLSAVNRDNEQPSVTVSSSANQTSEAGASVDIQLHLDVQPAINSTITIDANSDNLNEADLSPSRVSFNDSDWNIDKTIRVTGKNDEIADGNIDYGIHFSVSADTNGNPYTGLSINPVLLSNVDNDFLRISSLPGQVSDSHGQSIMLMVQLLQVPPADILINANSSDPSAAKVYPRDASDQAQDLIFTPTSLLNQAQVFRVVGQALAPASPLDYQVNFTINSNSSADTPVQTPASMAFQHVTDAPIPASGDAVFVRYIEPSGTSDIDPSNLKFKIMHNDGVTIAEATAIETFSDVPHPINVLSGTPMVVNEGQSIHWQLINDHLETHHISVNSVFRDYLQGGELGDYHFSAPPPGTYLIGSSISNEQAMGLVTSLVVKPSQANTPWNGGPTFNQDITWLITDLDSTWIGLKVNANDPTPTPNTAFTPDVQLVNGLNATQRTDANGTRLVAYAGETILLRIINGGSLRNTIEFPNAGNSGVKEISRNGVHAANIAALPFIDSVTFDNNETVMLLYTVPNLAQDPLVNPYPILIHNAFINPNYSIGDFTVINSNNDYAFDKISVLEMVPGP